MNEIYQGTAAQMYDYLGPFHPEVPSIADIKLRHGFVYDFDRANSMVEDAMVLAGAEKRAGKWYYKDEPVSIKALIRTEDERRDIGDSFAADIEKLGFTIEYIHTTFGPAIDIVYGTDPAEFEWGFYTEGWGIGASRWNTWEPGCWGGSADPELGDWCANMPGWAEEGWWQYVSPGARVDILSTDINYGRYTDLADREEKMREATDLIMQESVRIFGIRQLTAYPARRDVEGLTQDMGQGLRGAVWAPREAYREGSTRARALSGTCTQASTTSTASTSRDPPMTQVSGDTPSRHRHSLLDPIMKSKLRDLKAQWTCHPTLTSGMLRLTNGLKSDPASSPLAR